MVKLDVYKKTFAKGVYKTLSGAHLSNKTPKIMLEQTFYNKVLTEVAL